MEHEFIKPEVITIRPATIFAFIKIFPLVIAAIAFLFLAARYFPGLVLVSIAVMCFAWYRYLFIRRSVYEITPEIIRIRRGIFFCRTDQVELWRIKDYIITQPFWLQVFGLMDLTLKGTDPENPVIWLRGIPRSDLVDVLRERVNEARQHNRLYELN
jgi:uncharacterized membrane protein YdbT with pleckstrin-like domain